mgnify:CR=1 FL=1
MALSSYDIIQQMRLPANKDKTVISPQYLADPNKVSFVGDTNISWANNFPDLATARQYGAAEPQVKGYNPNPQSYASNLYGQVPHPPGSKEAQQYIENYQATRPPIQVATPPVEGVQTTTPPATPAPQTMSDLQKRLITMGQGVFDQGTQPFQYGNLTNEMLKRMSLFDPNEFAGWARTPVNWNEDQIRSTYSGAFSDLARQRELATKTLLAELQSRGLGRTGMVETSLGDLASEYGRQESNVIQNVLGQLLPKAEELTQSKRGMQLEGYGTAGELAKTMGGMETEAAGINVQRNTLSANVLNTMQQAATAGKGQDIEAAKLEIDKILKSRELDIDTKLANLQELMTNSNINNDVKRVALESTRTEYDRMGTEAQTALARGNLALAEKQQKDSLLLQQGYADMASQQQGFQQGATQQQMKQNFLDTLVNVYGMELADATKIWQTVFGQLAGAAA